MGSFFFLPGMPGVMEEEDLLVFFDADAMGVFRAAIDLLLRARFDGAPTSLSSSEDEEELSLDEEESSGVGLRRERRRPRPLLLEDLPSSSGLTA